MHFKQFFAATPVFKVMSCFLFFRKHEADIREQFLIPVLKRTGWFGDDGNPRQLVGCLSLGLIEKNFFKEPTAQGHDALWIIESLEIFR